MFTLPQQNASPSGKTPLKIVNFRKNAEKIIEYARQAC